jgi:hypothetical protein
MTDRHAHGSNRNAVLALWGGECDAVAARRTRAHIASCADCGADFEALSRLESALLASKDDAPPARLRDQLVARATALPQLAPRPRPDRSAAPLLALLPVMALVVVLVWVLGAWLAASPAWAAVTGASPTASFGAAALLFLALGGLASLSLAPVLVLSSRRSAR